jgi:hypothetical protein
MRRYMPSVKYKAMQKIILGLLVVGVLVAAFLITRPLIQIVEENLSTAEQYRILERLKAPSEEAPLKAQGALSVETTLPITMLMGIPFIRVYIQGRPYLLQLDFGSRYTFLSPDVALQLQLPIISEGFREKGPAGGEFSYYFARVKEIQLGAAKVLHDRVAIEMRRIYAKVFGLLKVFDYKGLVGAQTLKHFLLTLNLAKKRLILRPKGSPTPLASSIPFTSVGDLIMLSGFLDGQGPFNLLLDPGAPVLVLAPEVAEQLKLVGKRSSVKLELQQLPELTQPVYVAEDLQGAYTDGVRLDGLLGRSLLQLWQVTVDFERQMVYFESP